MTISCIANGSKKTLLWCGLYSLNLYSIALVSTAVFYIGCVCKGISYQGISHRKQLLKNFSVSIIISTFLSTAVASILATLPIGKETVCAALIAWSVFCGLAYVYTLDRMLQKKDNELLSLFPTHSFMDRFCSFKTPREALKFHRVNNKLITQGNVKEAREACVQYIRPYLDSHPSAESSLIVSNTQSDSDMVRCFTEVDMAIKLGIVDAIKTCNYSLLICFSLMRGIPFIIGVCQTLEQKNIKQYRLFCKIFDSQDVDYACLRMLIFCHPTSEELRSFWLPKMNHVKFPSYSQLRSREKGSVLKDSSTLSSFALNKLLTRAVMSQSKEYLIFLIGQGANVNFVYGSNSEWTPILALIFNKFHSEIDINFLDLLVQYGADLHHQCNGFSILELLFFRADANLSYFKSFNVGIIVNYLIKKGVRYDRNRVSPLLLAWIDELRSSLALN